MALPPNNLHAEPRQIEDQEFDVFLSHKSKDKPAVRELADALLARGLRPWLDERQLVPGRHGQDLLEHGTRNSASVAVLIGKDGLGPWEDEEMKAALQLAVKDKQRPVIPVLLPGAPSQPELPLFLGNRTWVDLRSGFTAEGIERLVWGITGKKPNQPRPAKKPADADSLDESASAKLSAERLAELTSFANEQIAVAAQGWLDTECAPFIVPSLARHCMGDEPPQMMRPSRQRQPLDDDQVETLVLGQLSATANRVRASATVPS